MTRNFSCKQHFFEILLQALHRFMIFHFMENFMLLSLKFQMYLLREVLFLFLAFRKVLF